MDLRMLFSYQTHRDESSLILHQVSQTWHLDSDQDRILGNLS